MGNKIEKHLLDMVHKFQAPFEEFKKKLDDHKLFELKQQAIALAKHRINRRLRNKYCMAGRPW